MSLDILATAQVIETMENFIERKRPEEEIRHELDISYKIEGQSIEIFEIRPYWLDPKEIIESPVAKTTYVKAKNHWKVFWMRGNLKWFPYKPASVDTLEEFLEIVETDPFGCFWG